MIPKELTVLLLLCLLQYCEARVSSRARTTPACYVDNTLTTFVCSNPLYEMCTASNRLCCGPDHYCCGYGTSCCKRTSLNGWELAGVITSTLAWVALLAVLSIMTVPRIQRKWRKYQSSVKPWNRQTAARTDNTEQN